MLTLVYKLTGSGDEAGHILNAGFHVINESCSCIKTVVKHIDDSAKMFHLCPEILVLFWAPLQLDPGRHGTVTHSPVTWVIGM